MRGLAAAFLAFALAFGQADDPWRELEQADAGRWGVAYALLSARGEPAAREALAGYAAASPRGRRSRASLVEDVGGATCISTVVMLLNEPLEREARLAFVRFLGDPRLGVALAAERTSALAREVSAGTDAEVRRQAIEALAGAGLPNAATALNGLFGELAPADRSAVAKALAQLPAGRARIVARVRGAFADGATELDPATLATLFAGYGPALAELPGGGLSAADRAPFVRGRRHPAPEVQRASLSALDALQRRLIELGELERADAILAALAQDGFEPRRLLYERIQLALSQRGDPELALLLAAALIRDSAASNDPDDRTWHFYGLHLRAAALFAKGEFARARMVFDGAQQVMAGLLSEREDLRPSLYRPELAFPASPFGGSVRVDRIEIAALEELWQALCLLAETGEAGGAAALEHLRRMHLLAIKAQLVSYQTDAALSSSTLDSLLDRPLGPGRLLLTNRALPGWGEGRGVELELLLGRGLATVAPDEMPGFEPLPGAAPALGDPFLDDERFALLVATSDAELKSAERDWMAEQRKLVERSVREGDAEALHPERLRRHPKFLRFLDLQRRRRELIDRVEGHPGADRALASKRRELRSELADYRGPSSYALSLAGRLRVDGRAVEARELSARMLADLRGGLPGAANVWTEWTSARLELSMGASYTDENQPREAERVSLNAVTRLEALENTLEQRRDKLVDSAESRRAYDSQIEQTRRMRANALLSLAVNANVRMGDTERALDYFERAYELDRRDFMRVLLACYRARSGKAEEARAVLRSVKPAPQLYYNLACTHALLGDTDEALDYLQRELSTNHPTEGSLTRQRQWAAEDPDLASLRPDPRFGKLVE